MSASFLRPKENSSNPNSQRKLPTVNERLLQERLPKVALQLASFLSDEEKEVLIFLVTFGGDGLFISRSFRSAGSSPWRPWKLSPSKDGIQKDGCPSCPLSAAFAASFMSPEESFSKGSLPSLSIFKPGIICDCFSSYSRAWSRWNASPNRDLINDILDVIENVPQNTPQGSKGKKKKKRLDKKRGTEKEEERDQTPELQAILSKVSDPPSVAGKTCDAVGNDNTQIIITVDHVPITIADTITIRHKKSLFRGLKQKHRARHNSLAPSPLSESNENEFSSSGSTINGLETAGGALAIEIPENLTVENSTSGVFSSSLVSSQVKTDGKLQQHARLGRHRNNQILPFDCEDVIDKRKEQELFMVVLETNSSMFPRPADVGLASRGFLSRVFPDALGRIASRLWDLISVRLHIRPVEYQ